MISRRCSHIHIPILASVLAAMVIFSGCGDRKTVSSTSHSRTYELKEQGLKALNYRDFLQADLIADSLLTLGEMDGVNTEATIYGKIIKGQASMYTGNFEESYPALHEAEALAIKNRNDSALASAYNGLGIYSMNIEKDNNEALRYFFLGLDAARRSKSERLHSVLLCNVASVYYLTENPMGLRYGMECYNRGKQTKDEYLRLIGSMTVAFSHMARREYDQALVFVREAELVMRSYNIKEGASLYTLYGMILRRLGKNEEAEKAFLDAIGFLNEEGYVTDGGDVRSFIEYGEMLADEGKYRQAMDVLESGLRYSDQGHEVTFRAELLSALSRVSRLSDNAAKAREYDMMRLSESDSIQNHEKEIAIAQLRSKYDLERVENEINRQRVEILEKRNQLYVLGLIIGVAVCLLLSIIILYRHKSRLYTAMVRQMTDSVNEEARLRDIIRELESRPASNVDGNKPNSQEIRTTPQDEGTTSDSATADDDTESETGEDTTDSEPGDEASQEAGAMPQELYNRLKADMEAVLSEPAIFTDKQLNKERLARKLGTNRTYLSRFINSHYKMSFTQLINSMRIKEAIRLLSDPTVDIPLKNMAEQIGFNSQTTFYTKFSEATGMTPAAFRSRARSMTAG